MDNLILSSLPISTLLDQLRQIIREEISQEVPGGSSKASSKPVDEKALCEFLGISHVTAGKMRKRGQIPFLQIGSAIRYDLSQVVEALENKKSKK